MNKHEMTEILTVLTTVWTKEPMPEETQQAYFWALGEEQADIVKEAARRWIRTGKFFPKPAELISLANEIKAERIKSGVMALPAPETRKRTPEGYLTLIRVESLANKYGISLSPYVMDAIDEAHAWQKASAA